MRKIEIRNYPKFQLIKSPNETLIIIKIEIGKNGFDETLVSLTSELKDNYMERAGVYFLKLNDGYYIGETNNLTQRLKDHMKNKEIDSITFATYKSELDQLNKEEVRDLESILMEYAIESGLTLGNVKNEKRKTYNMLDYREHQMTAQWIWKSFAHLNIEDILDDVKSNNETNIVVEDEVKKINSDYDIKKCIVIANVLDRIVDNTHEIFKYIDYTNVPTSGYMKKRIEIFDKEHAKTALYRYLYDGKGNKTVDTELTHSKRRNGYVTAVTLAYMRIQTNGNSRGKMCLNLSEEQAKNIINEFIDSQY